MASMTTNGAFTYDNVSCSDEVLLENVSERRKRRHSELDFVAGGVASMVRLRVIGVPIVRGTGILKYCGVSDEALSGALSSSGNGRMPSG